MMSESTPTGPIHLGFLTVFQEGAAYLGGYLVTNSWGRPLEFRLSTAVQPNRVQQILYGATLHEYLCADLIGKTLVDRCATPVQLLLTDAPGALPLRDRLGIPALAIVPPDDPTLSGASERRLARLEDNRSPAALAYDPRHAADLERIRFILERIDPGLDVNEPFSRIREAMGEARKLGATSRAA